MRFFVIISSLLSLAHLCFDDVYGQTFDTDRYKIEKPNDSTYCIKWRCRNHEEIKIMQNTVPDIIPSKVVLADVSSAKKESDEKKHQNNLIVHGNMLYSFNYRSYMDTPYQQSDLMQHILQAKFNVTIKEKFPFTVLLTTRRSNSIFFLNTTDVNIQYNQNTLLGSYKQILRNLIESQLKDKKLQFNPETYYQYDKEIKTSLLKKLTQKADSLSDFNKKWEELYSQYKSQRDSIDNIETHLNSSAKLQDEIEAKETALRKLLANKKIKDSSNYTSPFNLDSSTTKFNDSLKYSFNSRQQKLTILKDRATKNRQKLEKLQGKYKDSLLNIKLAISQIASGTDLQKYIAEHPSDSLRLSAAERFLLSIKQIGIGRCWLDYSDLTVKNVSINGFNIETNPKKLYVAVALGKVNYRFRDFVINDNVLTPTQDLLLARMGYGNKEGNNFIFTYYKGHKALFNQVSLADSNVVQPISGFSVEGKLDLNKNNYLVAEYAKSETVATKGKMFSLLEQSNEAWGIKLFNEIKSSHTKLTSYYRHIGENFQSFTLMPTNAIQEAWMIKVNQAFDKNRITLDASVKKNDFFSYLPLNNFSSNNIFKTVQLSVRYPKYPFVMVGYYPTTQLISLDNKTLVQNQFNTLNAVVNYNYTFRKTALNTNLGYTKFYNNSTDSSFTYYNAITLNLQQTIYLGNFSIQCLMSQIEQSAVKFITVEPSLSYTYKNCLSITSGFKHTKSSTESSWGGLASVNWNIKRIGIIQLQYDKSFIPTYNKTLKPIDIGRLTFIRTF